MPTTLPGRVEAALSKMPADIRAINRRDIRWLESRMELTVENLGRAVADPALDSRARALSAWMIGLVQERSLCPVLERTANSSPPEEVLLEIAKALCVLKQGGPLFRKLLSQSPDPSTRKIAAFALGCLQDASSVDELCTVLGRQDEVVAVRGQAAESLGYLESSRAVTTLLEAAQDPHSEVRFWAIFALGQLRAPEAEPLLDRIAAQDGYEVEGYGSVAEEAKEALQRIRGQ